MIYIVSHKQFALPELDNSYFPIYVGDKVKNYAKENQLLTDDFSDTENISVKNMSYCELTALFWIWKNDLESDYIGLNHYRRFFLSKTNSNQILGEDETNLSLKENDIILPQKLKFRCTIEKYYCRTTGYEKDLQTLESIIYKEYPDYLEAYRLFLSGHEMVYANMFVMSRELLSQYCKWLFEILFQVEKIIDITDYTPAEKRVFGYMGELLLNVWVIHNELKADYYPIINTEVASNLKRDMINSAKEIIKKIVYFPSGIPYRRRIKKRA